MNYLIITNTIFVFLVSFSVTFFSILLLSPIAKKIGIVDKPSKRKKHQGHIPLVGGVCIFLGVLICSILYLNNNHILISLMVSSLFILLLGFIDDCYPLPVMLRFSIQFVIVSIMVWYTGLRFETIGHSFGLPEQISLGFLSYPFTIIGIVFVTNAFNLMDGADGVTGSLTILAIVGINIVDLLFVGNSFNIILIALFGSLIPFIWFNLLTLPKYKIFLGDNGSLFLGYMIACLLLYQIKVNISLSPTLAFWIIAIPIFDVIAVIIFRLRRSGSLFTPDRSHLHYFLRNMGFSKYLVLIFIIGLGTLLMFFGISIEILNRSLSFPIFLLLLFMYIWFRVFSSQSKFNT